MSKARPSDRGNLTPRQIAARRARVMSLATALPEARAEPCGELHLSLEVRGKRFGWFLNNHHDDGRLALNCKAPQGASRLLAEAAPEKFHIPKHVGHLGWLGMWLDLPQIDWDEVQGVLADAYRLTAPKSLAARLAGLDDS
jgi:hypothetical protein